MEPEEKPKERIEQSVKGIHWGKFALEKDEFNLQYKDKEILHIPYNKIANSYCVQKSEVNLELNIDD